MYFNTGFIMYNKNCYTASSYVMTGFTFSAGQDKNIYDNQYICTCTYVIYITTIIHNTKLKISSPKQ